MKVKNRVYSAEFKREAAELVIKQGYSLMNAARAMGVSKSAMGAWVQQLREEYQGVMPKSSPITPEKIEIRALQKKIQQIEMENDILKKATALLMSGSLKNFR